RPRARRAPPHRPGGDHKDPPTRYSTGRNPTMALVLSATWIAKAGEEQTVLEALRNLSPASREEPGNLYYQAYQDPDERRALPLFLIFLDEEGGGAHTQQEHLQRG